MLEVLAKVQDQHTCPPHPASSYLFSLLHGDGVYSFEEFSASVPVSGVYNPAPTGVEILNINGADQSGCCNFSLHEWWVEAPVPEGESIEQRLSINPDPEPA